MHSGHSLLTKGYVNSGHRDLNYDPDGVLQLVEKFQHTTPLVSSYSSYYRCNVAQEIFLRKMDVGTRESHFTNLSYEFQGKLDYMFHT